MVAIKETFWDVTARCHRHLGLHRNYLKLTQLEGTINRCCQCHLPRCATSIQATWCSSWLTSFEALFCHASTSAQCPNPLLATSTFTCAHLTQILPATTKHKNQSTLLRFGLVTSNDTALSACQHRGKCFTNFLLFAILLNCEHSSLFALSGTAAKF